MIEQLESRTMFSVPASPTNLTATLDVQGKFIAVNLQWQDNADNEEQYQIMRCVDGYCDGNAWTQVAFLPANSTTYTDHIHKGYNYVYSVRALNYEGASQDWAQVLVVTTNRTFAKFSTARISDLLK
jgi:hypothetical protein